jgi:DNA-binding MarR family transcriptional regulator
MGECNLTENEKLVLYGMVKFPEFGDRELAEKLGLKLPTVTSIRHRLEKEGYIFTTVWTPDIKRLGLNLLNVSYSTYAPSLATPKRMGVANELAMKQEEVVWSLSEPGQQVSIQLSSDYYYIKKNLDDMEEALAKAGMLEEKGIVSLTFHSELCGKLVLFDFSPMLESLFDINLPRDSGQGQDATGQVTNLSETEKAVLIGLSSNPTMSNRELAEEIGISRYTIGRLRKRFEDEELIRKCCIPDLLKLGFEIMVFSHARFNLNIPKAKREEAIQSVLTMHPSFFVIKNSVEAISIEAYTDFEEFKRNVGKFSSIYEKHNIFQKEPTRLLFSIPVGRTVKEYDYTALLKKHFRL